MSQWTQVSGSVRIDGLLFNGKTDVSIRNAIEDSLGVQVTYDSPKERWDAENKTPTGSEGGLGYEYIVTARDEGSISRGVLVITGSLRDYGLDEYPEILAWLNNTFANSDTKGYFVRQGAVEVQIEGEKTVLFIWDESKSEFKEIEIV